MKIAAIFQHLKWPLQTFMADELLLFIGSANHYEKL